MFWGLAWLSLGKLNYFVSKGSVEKPIDEYPDVETKIKQEIGEEGH